MVYLLKMVIFHGNVSAAEVSSLAATAQQPAVEAFLEAMKPPRALATWHCR
jgi:hypothetical protein